MDFTAQAYRNPELEVVVLPTIDGFVFEVLKGVPPFEVFFLGKEPIVKTSDGVFKWTTDRTFGLRDLFFTVRDAEGNIVSVEPGVRPLDFYERGFLLEIQRREFLVLKTRGGFVAKLYKKRRRSVDGECPECSLEEKYVGAEDSWCPFCFGTGIAGGYYPPLEVLVNYYDRTDVRGTEAAPLRITNESFWSVGVPVVEKDDLLFVPAQGKLFRIMGAKYYEYKGTPVKQLFEGSELEPGHPLYLLTRQLSVVVRDAAAVGSDSISAG